MSEHQEKFTHRADAEVRKAAEHLKKEEGVPKEKVDTWATQVSRGVHKAASTVTAGINGAVQGARSITAAVAAKTHSLASQSWQQVHNPVVLFNVLLGTGAVSSLLCGYAHYDTRYLKGKSDGAVLAIVGGATALVAADAVLSAKYYKKYRK
ncbi:OM14 (YBR230C) [Zygosaccharomyces parabailii]|uniref:BN860_12838g1_1 n=1 Tax=Zygosaccharomyces bailii (strain CLIB 213 / ATCC 58445 / CBS 680 / BCRC 21525 / NBRC 1098 / NCYC 1416 / NRRL Y-2227) TaxID=1333698 RepID=A0A8J2T5E9_ZYGB2|nr:OM14 (YBR230C) [Zygosaccharomyces parabailii]CDF88549.1 BN860_12838g1_1 [Zygosaccharomyces bailii CLIB 213]SJM82313.1 uncharacterized protein ZBIST_0421 [Zygosaccharomyces bailii]